MGQRSFRCEIEDWITGDALVVTVRGSLDAETCGQLADRLRELVVGLPGVRITLDLKGVTEVDQAACEDLVLQIVGVHARRALITFAGAHGGMLAVLSRWGIAAAPRGDRGGFARALAGVTA